jgi:hypothetical protein
VNRVERTALGALKGVLGPLGCTISLVRKNKHQIIQIDGPGGLVSRRPIPKTPHADPGDMEKALVCDARRLARSWGLIA